jgi:hypothetical protein
MSDGQISPHAFVEAMTLPMWQASAAVRWLEGRVENLPKTDEATPEKAALTFGDCVSQEILLTALRSHYAWVEIDAEEDTPTAQAFAGNRAGHRVLLDPIDGTMRYLRQDGLYAILLGLEHEARIEAALIALPQKSLLITAVRGQGAMLAQDGGAPRPITPLRAASRNRRRSLAERHGSVGAGRCLLVSHALPEGLRKRLHQEGYTTIRAAGGAIGVAPLLDGTAGAIRTTPSPDGLSARTWISTLATLEAGGSVETICGSFPERFEPGVCAIVVSGPADAADLRALVAEYADGH